LMNSGIRHQLISLHSHIGCVNW